jgi:hypothetical protein
MTVLQDAFLTVRQTHKLLERSMNGPVLEFQFMSGMQWEGQHIIPFFLGR